MLFGDACGVFTLFVSQESTSLEEYQTTLDVLKSFRNEYDRILRQHGTCESPVSLLDEDMEIVHSILEGTDDQMPYVFNGIPCFIARKTDQEHGNVRIDGKQGNVVYIKEKIWKESE